MMSMLPLLCCMAPAAHVQEDNMLSNQDLKKKYASAQDYEDDFM